MRCSELTFSQVDGTHMKVPTWVFVIAPIVLWVLAYQFCVAPAEQQKAFAHQALLIAEKEELTQTLEVEREELIVERMQRRLQTMKEDATRLQVAEVTAKAELARGDVYRSGSGHWVMPFEKIVGNPRT